jgi:hypothetical protein
LILAFLLARMRRFVDTDGRRPRLMGTFPGKSVLFPSVSAALPETLRNKFLRVFWHNQPNPIRR